MFGQKFAGLLHSVDDARGEFGFAKVIGHGIRQLPPEFVPALRVHGLIADDGKFVRARCHENQHPVPFVDLFIPRRRNSVCAAATGSSMCLVADADADFAGGLVFGIPNRRDNACRDANVWRRFSGA